MHRSVDTTAGAVLVVMGAGTSSSVARALVDRLERDLGLTCAVVEAEELERHHAARRFDREMRRAHDDLVDMWRLEAPPLPDCFFDGPPPPGQRVPFDRHASYPGPPPSAAAPRRRLAQVRKSGSWATALRAFARRS